MKVGRGGRDGRMAQVVPDDGQLRWPDQRVRGMGVAYQVWYRPTKLMCHCRVIYFNFEVRLFQKTDA